MQTLKIQIGNEVMEIEIIGVNQFRFVRDFSANRELLTGAGIEFNEAEAKEEAAVVYDGDRLDREVKSMLSRAIIEARR